MAKCGVSFFEDKLEVEVICTVQMLLFVGAQEAGDAQHGQTCMPQGRNEGTSGGQTQAKGFDGGLGG